MEGALGCPWELLLTQPSPGRAVWHSGTTSRPSRGLVPVAGTQDLQIPPAELSVGTELCSTRGTGVSVPSPLLSES